MKLTFLKPVFWISIYLVIVLIYTLAFWLGNPSEKVMLDSNELGDFLAGTFAPIAFIYLFLGYKQQEKALAKTNQDLLKQLQIQQQLLELQISAQHAKEHSALPIVTHMFYAEDVPFDTNRINVGTGKLHESFKRKITMEFSNSGETVSQVNVKCVEPYIKSITYNEIMRCNQTLKSTLFINEDLLDDYNQDGIVELTIHLEYCTNLGIKYVQYYEITISSQRDTPHPLIMYSAKSNPIKLT